MSDSSRASTPSATLDQSAATRDMSCIRATPTGAFVVRISSGGKQTHCGTFDTHAEALRVRDANLAALEDEARPVRRPRVQGGRRKMARVEERAAAAPTAGPSGVYPRFSMQGTRYDVYKTIRGHTLYGGSYATADAAAEAHSELGLDERRAVLPVAQKERGITVRYNCRRHEEPRARYVARLHASGGRHVGVFDTREEARDALTQALATEAASQSAGA